MYYKGYVPTNGKKAMLGYKDPDKLLSEAEAAKYTSYGGVLAEDIMMLDFDNLEEAKICQSIIKGMGLSCKIVQSDRGMHFLFRRGNVCKSNSAQVLACGLTCDVKCGAKNSYEILKLDGVVRPVIQECDIPDVIPNYLTPIPNAVERKTINVGNRNQTLFGYILTLVSAGFDNQSAKTTIEVINQYVLDEPLPINELKVITRDEAFDKCVPNFFDNNKFQHHKFAKWLKDRENIIKISGVLHVYDRGIYINGEECLCNKMIDIIPALTERQMKEVYHYLRIFIRFDTPEADTRYVAFENGIFDITTRQMIPFSPDIVLTNKIPHNYCPLVPPGLVDKTLLKLACGNEGLRDLLEELVGYFFLRRNELGKAFFLLGGNNNGKSTYINMIKAMLGKDNIAALDVADFTKTFHCASLLGKLANLGDDIGDNFIADASAFKKLCTGDMITVENKYEKPFTLCNYAKMLFSANIMPRINDRTGAVARRIIPIPFNAYFSADDPDYNPFISTELKQTQNIQRLILLGLNGLERVLSNNKFTTTDEVQHELREIAKTNNPVLLWIEEEGLDTVVNHDVVSVYGAYRMWAYNYGITPLGAPQLAKTLEMEFKLIKKQTMVGKRKAWIWSNTP